jgi:hypothetical protein
MRKQSPYIFLIIVFSLGACKVNFRTTSFVPKKEVIDYSETKHWAVYASVSFDGKAIGAISDSTVADVFYVYPTLLVDKKDTDWNASIDNSNVNSDVIKWIIPYQASAWADAGRLFVPFYRQNHYRAFFKPHINEGGIEAIAFAYADVKAAFDYYMEFENNGRPIILAGHSQGAHHLKKILQKYFDDKPLQNKLVAAYLIGTRVLEDEFNSLKPLNTPDQIGGYVSWNSYKKGKYPKYYAWYNDAVNTNPVTWDDSKVSLKQDHKGLLYYDNVLYEKSLEVEKVNGMLWVSLPNVPKRFWMSFVKDYHRFDVTLFWEDIRQNALQRVKRFNSEKLTTAPQELF